MAREVRIEADGLKLHQLDLQLSDLTSAISSHPTNKRSRFLISSRESVDPSRLLYIVVGRNLDRQVQLKSWEDRQIAGFNDVVVRICGDREANDSRLWAWPNRRDLWGRHQADIGSRFVPLGRGRALVVEVLEPSHEVLARRGQAGVQWLCSRAEITARFKSARLRFSSRGR